IPQTIGVEHNHFTLDRYETLTQTFPSIQVTDITHMLANMRVIKNQEEYHLLKQAAELADFGVKTGVEAIKEGVSELEIMATVEYELKKQGIQEMAFATTVLSGPKTASPHRSEEHTSELQSRFDLVCRLLLEKKNNNDNSNVRLI